ncbi:MAG: hypothetical protein WC489_08380 [Patescibacteria group bacterium]|jgi:hypothetical protein
MSGIFEQNFWQLAKLVEKWAVILLMLIAIVAIMIFSLSGTEFNFGDLGLGEILSRL